VQKTRSCNWTSNGTLSAPVYWPKSASSSRGIKIHRRGAMIRSSTMPWIPHKLRSGNCKYLSEVHIGHPASGTLPRDCFTTRRNRQNRAGRVRLRGCERVRRKFITPWQWCENGRLDSERRGLFSGSLKIVIRTDGHHRNPLTANPSVRSRWRTGRTAGRVPYLVSVATPRRLAPRSFTDFAVRTAIYVASKCRNGPLYRPTSSPSWLRRSA